MKKCPNCNFIIENENAKFCKKRGTRLPQIEKKTEEPVTHNPYADGISLGSIIDPDPAENIHEENTNDNKSTENVVSEDNSPEEVKRKIGMFGAVGRCLKQTFSFKGRATRSEYWYFSLFSILFVFSVYFLAFAIAVFLKLKVFGVILLGIDILYFIISFISGISASVRRLHDIGKSGKCYWLLLIPIIGLIIFIYYLCKSSDKGENKYG